MVNVTDQCHAFSVAVSQERINPIDNALHVIYAMERNKKSWIVGAITIVKFILWLV
jgi:hypothetical protein